MQAMAVLILCAINVYYLWRVTKMGEILTQLTEQVTRNTAVIDSAITLINGLAAKIEEMKTDPVALQALADELRTNADNLGAAVTANTPA